MANPKPKRTDARSRNLKLTDAEWSALERIARHRGTEWAGVPSRTEAVRSLIRQEIERIDAEARKAR